MVQDVISKAAADQQATAARLSKEHQAAMQRCVCGAVGCVAVVCVAVVCVSRAVVGSVSCDVVVCLVLATVRYLLSCACCLLLVACTLHAPRTYPPPYVGSLLSGMRTPLHPRRPSPLRTPRWVGGWVGGSGVISAFALLGCGVNR